MKQKKSILSVIMALMAAAALSACLFSDTAAAEDELITAVSDQPGGPVSEPAQSGDTVPGSSETIEAEDPADLISEQAAADPEAEADILTEEAEAGNGITTAEEFSEDHSVFFITLENVSLPGNETISAAAWSDKNGQDDLKWNKAEIINGNTARISIDLHEYRSLGTYSVHIYRISPGGEHNFLTGLTFDAETAELESPQAEINDGICSISVKSSGVPAGIESVRAAVWSSAGGQDDLMWIPLAYDSRTGSFASSFPAQKLLHPGEHIVHVYVKNIVGESRFAGGTVFKNAGPEAEEINAKTDLSSGSFTVTVSGVTGTAQKDKIRAAVWCAEDQSDVRWYDAVKISEDSFRIEGSVKDHKYSVGTYKVHAYCQSSRYGMVFLKGGEIPLSPRAGAVSVTEPDKKGRSELTVREVIVSGGFKKLQAAVWSSEGGQDDLRWYDLAKTGEETFSSVIDINDHKHDGQYIIHIYAQTSGGRKVFVGASSDLRVEIKLKGQVSVSDPDKNDGEFNAGIELEQSKWNVKGMTAAVWTRPDQSDIRWYNMIRRSDGRYDIPVSVNSHKSNFGEYKIHVYAEVLGMKKFAGGASYELPAPENHISVQSSVSPDRKSAVIQNAPSNIKKVVFYVWSDIGGQDDLKAYNASQKNGRWIADIAYSNHKHPGVYYLHAYADGRFLSGTSFDFYSDSLRGIFNEIWTAHAGGAVDGTVYTNSLEALLSSYDRGIRSFEVDLTFTSDGKLVLKHSSKDEVPVDYDTFMNSRIAGKYTPMDTEDLLLFMKEHPDIWIVTDTKSADPAQIRKAYKIITETAYSLGLTEVLDRMNIQIFSKEMYGIVEECYPFRNMLFSCYLTWNGQQSEFEKICSWCREKKVSSVGIWHWLYNANIKKAADRLGLSLYLYTVNDKTAAEKFLKDGVRGIYTDFIFQK